MTKKMNAQIKEVIQKSVERLEMTTCDEETARKLYDDLEHMSFGTEADSYTLSPIKMIIDSWNVESFLENHFSHLVVVSKIARKLEKEYRYNIEMARAVERRLKQDIDDLESKAYMRAREDGHTQGNAKNGWTLYEDVVESREALQDALHDAREQQAFLQSYYKPDINFLDRLWEIINGFADRLEFIKAHGRASYESWFQDELIDTFVEYLSDKKDEENELTARAEFAKQYQG